MLNGMTEPRVYMCIAEIGKERDLGQTDMRGAHAALGELIRRYFTDRGFTLDKLVLAGKTLRKPDVPGGERAFTGEIIVAIHGDPEDIERAVKAFTAPPTTYPFVEWELVTNETLRQRAEFREQRAEVSARAREINDRHRARMAEKSAADPAPRASLSATTTTRATRLQDLAEAGVDVDDLI